MICSCRTFGKKFRKCIALSFWNNLRTKRFALVVQDDGLCKFKQRLSEKDLPAYQILQHDETNFNFIKRLAAWQGRRVWVNDTRQGKCSLKVAPCVDDTPNEISDEEIIRLKLGRRGSLHTAELVAGKYFELGRVLKMSGNPCKFLIVTQKIYQDNGVDRVYFELKEFIASRWKIFRRTPDARSTICR